MITTIHKQQQSPSADLTKLAMAPTNPLFQYFVPLQPIMCSTNRFLKENFGQTLGRFLVQNILALKTRKKLIVIHILQIIVKRQDSFFDLSLYVPPSALLCQQPPDQLVYLCKQLGVFSKLSAHLSASGSHGLDGFVRIQIAPFFSALERSPATAATTTATTTTTTTISARQERKWRQFFIKQYG